MNRKLITAAVVAVCASGIALFPSNNGSEVAARPVAEGETFNVDTLHSGVFYKIRHMGVSNFMGRFNKFEGSFNLDWENPTSSFIDITVDAASVDSNNKKRDDHLRSPDFFNTKQFPSITFEGKQFKKTSDKDMAITGELTFLGVTNTVEVRTTLVDVGNTAQGYKMGLDTTFTIKRTDFNNAKYIEEGALGDEVELSIFLAGKRADG